MTTKSPGEALRDFLASEGIHHSRAICDLAAQAAIDAARPAPTEDEREREQQHCLRVVSDSCYMFMGARRDMFMGARRLYINSDDLLALLLRERAAAEAKGYERGKAEGEEGRLKLLADTRHWFERAKTLNERHKALAAAARAVTPYVKRDVDNGLAMLNRLNAALAQDPAQPREEGK